MITSAHHLGAPAERALLEAFKAKLVGHPLLKSTYEDLMQVICEPAGYSLAAVMGPTGVGKSTLINKVHKTAEEDAGDAIRAHPDIVPVVRLEVPSPETGSFSWRDFYLRALAELKEPASDWQVALRMGHGRKPEMARLSSLNQTELRIRMESACAHRKVRLLLVDEAQHLTKMSSGRRLLDQMDALKSIASLSGVFVVLVGTYELIRLLELNGQLARRCRSIHLPRHRRDAPAEWVHFQTVLRSLESGIALAGKTDLVCESELLYRGSAGCIGILKGWLTRAYAQALRTGLPELNGEVLRRTALPSSSIRKIAQEVKEGEVHWERSHADDPEIDVLLGIPGKIIRPAGKTADANPASAAPRSRSVGIRAPTRDPVGMEAVA